ncbi:putative Ubiquitin protein [Giardia muris]|uniref:Putative Ubiquitin protein n=1 Tax=Giardia muris TaxID=5742 RepID=A0A4Z1ST26_GIAMU|nr:putative Ubiquitin protein [Giardia muris]|eukprot:TNJ29044.1 putative Ubiquitin protein [Giardia muris]
MLELRLRNPVDKGNESIAVIVDPSVTVDEFRKQAADALGVEPSRLRLIRNGAILADGRPISSYGISGDTVVHYSIRKQAPPQTTPSEPPATTTEVRHQVSPPALSSHVTPEQRPDGLTSITQMFRMNPIFRSVMSNPDFVRNAIINNPAIQRFCEANPEIRAQMDNPETINMLVEVMQDPDKLKEMLNTTDRALTELTNMPGGTAILEKLQADLSRLQRNMDALGSPPPDVFGLNGDTVEGSDGLGSAQAIEYLHQLLGNSGDTFYGGVFDSMLDMLSTGSGTVNELGYPLTYSGLLLRRSQEEKIRAFTLPLDPLPRQGGMDVFGPNPNAMLDAFASNPMMQGMLRDLANNPALIRQHLSNPMIRNYLQQYIGDNPMMMSILDNPDFLSSMLGMYLNRADTTMGSTAASSFGQGPQGGMGGVQNLEALRVTFASQLEQIHDMGILGMDEQVLRLLAEYNGNVTEVINRLFG